MQTKRQQKLMKIIGFVAIFTIILGLILPYVSLGTTTAAPQANETQLTQVDVPSNEVTVK